MMARHSSPLAVAGEIIAEMGIEATDFVLGRDWLMNFPVLKVVRDFK